MKKNKLVFISIVLILIISFTFLVIKYDNITGSSVKNVQKDKIVLAHGKWILTAPIFIAKEKGFFDEQGLDVEFKYFNSGRDDLQAVLGGSADIATVAETPLVFGGFENIDAYITATFMTTLVNNKLVSRKDKVNSIEDLRNKKIATLFGTSAEFFTREFLNKNGINENEVDIINLNHPEMVHALIRGDIDAFVIWEPSRYQAKKELGDNYIEFEDRTIQPFTFNFVTKKDYAEQNEDKLVRFLRAINKANDYIKTNKEDSVKIVSSYTGLDEDFLASTWDDYDFQLSLDNSLVDLMKTQAGWSINMGLVDKKAIPDYKNMIYDRAINSIQNGK